MAGLERQTDLYPMEIGHITCWFRPLTMGDIEQSKQIEDEMRRAAYLIQRSCVSSDGQHIFGSTDDVIDNLASWMWEPLATEIADHSENGPRLDDNDPLESPSSPSPNAGESPLRKLGKRLGWRSRSGLTTGAKGLNPTG